MSCRTPVSRHVGDVSVPTADTDVISRHVGDVSAPTADTDVISRHVGDVSAPEADIMFELWKLQL